MGCSGLARIGGRGGVILNLGSEEDVLNNRVKGGACSLAVVGTSSVIVNGNVFEGGFIATLCIVAAAAILHGGHIIKGLGLAAAVAGSASLPPISSDMAGNYWGTTSADLIAAWIHDGNDDPSIPATVDLEPFSGSLWDLR